MTIADKLVAIFSASPAPVSLIGSRIFAVSAGQPTPKPYLVFQLISEMPIYTQENDNTTRHWRYQFCAIADTYEDAAAVAIASTNFLRAYTDRPHAGIQRTIALTQRDGWLETERGYERYFDMDIMENLP